MPENNNDNTQGPDLFKAKFLKGEKKKTTLKKMRKAIRQSFNNKVEELRTKAVESALETFREQAESIMDRWTDQKISISPSYSFSRQFTEIKFMWGEAKYRELVGSIVMELQNILQRNGLKKCVLQVWSGPELGDHILATQFYQSLMEESDDDEEEKPTRTNLEGKCPVCFSDNEKLVTFVPCGHTCCIDCSKNFVNGKCHTCREHVRWTQGVFPN